MITVEHVRLGPGGAQATNIKTKPKVFITDTKDMQLTGACVFFIKINPTKALTMANISQVMLLKLYNSHTLFIIYFFCEKDVHTEGKGVHFLLQLYQGLNKHKKHFR